MDPRRGVFTLGPMLKPVMPAVVQIITEEKKPDGRRGGVRPPGGDRGHGPQLLPKPGPDGRAAPREGGPRLLPRQDARPGAEHRDDVPPEGLGEESISTGSGVIVDANEGLILTNHHVLDGATRFRVRLVDGREFAAEKIGSDAATDIGLIKITADNLTAIPIGASDDLQVGDFVVAIGYPFGLEQTVTLGVVSGLGRVAQSEERSEAFQDFIQTDASINPGNSGGALIDTLGRLIGINTAIYSRTGGNIGIGFAVPTKIAIPIIEQLKAYGEVRRGRLGVEIRDLTGQIATALGISTRRGALITQVIEGSPSERAGLKSGDVVLSINGRPVHHARDLKNAVGLSPIDTEITIVALRDGKEVTLKARLTRPQVAAGALHLLGASFGPLPEDHPIARHVRGVLVTEVDTDSPAARSGLRKGDIVVELNRKETMSPEDLKRELAALGDVAALTVVRGNSELIIVVEQKRA